MRKKSKELILEVLDPHGWKLGRDIRRQVARKRYSRGELGPISWCISFFSHNTARLFYLDNHLRVNVYRLLSQLIDSGLVKCRQSMLIQRHPNLPPPLEYNLTDGGTRELARLAEKRAGKSEQAANA